MGCTTISISRWGNGIVAPRMCAFCRWSSIFIRKWVRRIAAWRCRYTCPFQRFWYAIHTISSIFIYIFPTLQTFFGVRCTTISITWRSNVVIASGMSTFCSSCSIFIGKIWAWAWITAFWCRWWSGSVLWSFCYFYSFFCSFFYCWCFCTSIHSSKNIMVVRLKNLWSPQSLKMNRSRILLSANDQEISGTARFFFWWAVGGLRRLALSITTSS